MNGQENLLNELVGIVSKESASDLHLSTANSISRPAQIKNLDQTLSQIADAEQALRRRPDSAKDNLSLGLALKSVREGEAAAKFFERALALDSGLAEAWYQKSIIEADQEQWTTAAAGFRRAVVLEPKA